MPSPNKTSYLAIAGVIVAAFVIVHSRNCSNRSVTVTVIAPPLFSESYEDCIGYDPRSLFITRESGSRWQLRSERHVLAVAENTKDASTLLAVAQQHTRQCFIGRNNALTDREKYLVRYWAGGPGVSAALLNTRCDNYNPQSVYVRQLSSVKFELKAVPDCILATVSNLRDAGRAMDLARRHSVHCFVGRELLHSSRGPVTEYWVK